MKHFTKLARGFVILFIMCMTCAGLPVVSGAGYFVAAESVEDYGEYDDPDEKNIFYITSDITDWSVLEDLPHSVYHVEFLDGQMLNGSLADFLNFKRPDNTAPCIIPVGTEKTVPFNILPHYDESTDTFQAGTTVIGDSTHSPYLNFEWGGTLKYVYGSPEPTVNILHEVYSDPGNTGTENKSLLSEIDDTNIISDNLTVVSSDTSNPTIQITDLDKEAHIIYTAAINYDYASPLDESYITPAPPEDLYYIYKLDKNMLSTVAAPDSDSILGSIHIKATEDGLASSSVQFELFTDADCKLPAQRYSATDKKWEDVGTIATDDNGSAVVSNMKSGTYYVKRLDDNSVKTVVLDKSKQEISLSGGETDTVCINKQTVTLEPDMNGDATATMDYLNINDDNNMTTVKAADYGGQLFIEDGNEISGYIGKLQELSACTVKIDKTDGLVEECTDFAAAIKYINDELITNKGLDAENARGHVKMTQLYADDEMVGSVEFSADKSDSVEISTGDISRIGIWLALMLSAILAAVIMTIRLRKR